MKEFTEEETIDLLRVLNQFVVALDNVGSYYESREMSNLALLYLIDKNKVFAKLAKARKVLSSKYSYDIMEGDDFSELEKMVADTPYCKMPTEKQLLNWKEKQAKLV